MNQSDRTLWMGDLESYMDANFIGEAFQRMGEEVRSVKVVHDKYTGRMAGYCFVELLDGESARRAMLNVNGKVIPKTKPPITFNLSFANSPSAPYTEYNLFVNNIPTDIDDAGLFLLFGERYRSCRGAKVYRSPDGASRGLGFVRFADQTDQQKALVEMNKFSVRGKQILLKLAQPKFRAPRTGGTPQYDPIAYYPQYQDFYNSPQWKMYDFQGQQQHQMHHNPMMGGQGPRMGPGHMGGPPQNVYSTPPPMMAPTAPPVVHKSPATPVNPELQAEPWALDHKGNVDLINEDFMEKSEEFYAALEESRWFPKLLTASVHENDL